MAEVGRNNQVGIPSGLNRIKTHRVSSKDHLNSKPDELTESRSCSVSKPPQNQKQKPIYGDGKFTNYSKEDLQKGKKMAGWFTTYISKFNNGTPNFEERSSGIRTFVKEGPKEFKSNHDGSHQNDDQMSTELLNCSKVSKGLKSFSHELGPKGGVPSAYPRAHSYSNLKELLETLHSKFETAKQVVNSELTSFARDVMDILEKTDSSFSEGKKMVEDLLILARECVEMSPSLFRVKCEIIVQDLTEKRQQCQVGLVKWLFSRMLFILTRCTRLLMFQKESQPIDEKSLQKFKKCLESVPSVESNWVPNPEMTNSDVNYALNQKSDSKLKLSGWNNDSSFPEAGPCISSADWNSITSKKVSTVAKQKLPSQDSEQRSCLQEQQLNQVDGRFPGKSVNNSSSVSLHGQEQALDGSNLVICRICEEIVPISYLESHSYICAYADKCELNCLDIDERLSKLAEILEQITESRNLSFHPPGGSPEHSKMLATNLSVTSECYSPKISEWRNKGVEGMFEDIHEMDTASIDDSHLSSINLKGHLGVKLSSYGASSSTGSMTSVSSTNTPRAGHFDAFWLERNSPSELEDVQQMIELADVARCVADTDHAEEGSCEFLLACMQDLQDILQNSKLKALVIDTFGSRIENILREKYILACEAQDVKVPTIINKMWETYRLPSDNASQSSAVSSPLNSSHKERTSIDDFDIIKPISRGAFGKVFLARKRTTGDLFAIKVLKKLDMIRKNDIERILAERNILITVRNPFVVRFFYSFTCRENLYLVMEYLNGGDLYSLLRKVGCIEEDVARIYIAELVLALEYLHSLAIVHRDLKPDNILIAHDGHIKLTDFGLSKIGLINNTVDLSGPETNGTLSSDSHNQHDDQHTGDRNQQSAVGTPDYLAPEILLGTEHGYAADWWSVGIILFELITGIPPFSAESPEIIFDNILNRKLPWPQVPEDMSFEAQDLINRLLIHDPDKRLGANGAAEVKAHAFFGGVNWDNLALQKAAFVPQPESHDDTSYFLSRFSQISNGIPVHHNSSDSDSDGRDSSSQFEDQVDECGEMEKFNTPLDLSLINFSFKQEHSENYITKLEQIVSVRRLWAISKNLSQLASINHDVLLHNGKDSTKTNLL